MSIITPSLPTVPSCGKSLPSTRTKTQREDGDGIGDIHIWGRNIFMGYLDDEEKTQEKIDLHGWLRTGDLGFLDDDEFLYVTGNERGEQDQAAGCSLPRTRPHGAAADGGAGCTQHDDEGRLKSSLEEGAPFVCCLSLSPLFLSIQGWLWAPGQLT